MSHNRSYGLPSKKKKNWVQRSFDLMKIEKPLGHQSQWIKKETFLGKTSATNTTTTDKEKISQERDSVKHN